MSEVIIDIKKIQEIESQMAYEVSRILEENDIYFSMAYGSVLGAIRHNGPIPWDLDMDMYIDFEKLWDVIKVLRDNLPAPFTVDYYDTNPKYRFFYPRVALSNSSSDIVHIDMFPLCGLPEDEQERVAFWNKIIKTNKIYYHYKNETTYVRKINRAKWKYIIAYCFAKGKELIYLPITKKRLRSKLASLYSEYPINDSKYVAADPAISSDVEIIEKDFVKPTNAYKYNTFMCPIPQEYDLYLKHFYDDYMTIPNQELIEERMQLTANISDTDYNLLFDK